MTLAGQPYYIPPPHGTKLDLPNNTPLKRNLCPRFRFSCSIVMCVAAPMTKRSRNTAVMGTSTLFLGRPPNDQLFGSQGAP